MELVPGESLAERLRRAGPLGPRAAVRIARDVARALEHAHARGVVHRDVKPANVLLGPDGRPKLTDFGLVKDLDGRSRLSATGQLLGTPGYWPPEQAEGRLDAIGPRSDVYALGATLFEAVSGRPPHPTSSLVEALASTQRPVALPEAVAADPPLAAICRRALAVEPDERFPTAGAMGEALVDYLAPAAAARGARAPVVAAAVLLAGGVVAAALLAWPSPRGGAEGSLGAPGGAPTDAVGAAAPGRSDGGDGADGADEDPRIADLLAQARARGEAGDHAGAIAHLDVVLALDPDHGLARLYRGTTRPKVGDLEGALADLDRAVALRPADPAAWLNRSFVRVKLGDDRGALADLDAALALDPDHGLALMNRGIVSRALGVGDPVSDLRRAADLLPDDPRTHFQLGRALFAFGRDREAVAPLGACLALEADHVEALRYRSAARLRLEELDGARTDVERALALAPADAELHFNHGVILQALGADAEAAAAYTESLDLRPDDPTAWINRGYVLATRIGRLEEARADFEAALRVAEPGSEQAARARALLEQLDDPANRRTR